MNKTYPVELTLDELELVRDWTERELMKNINHDDLENISGIGYRADEALKLALPEIVSRGTVGMPVGTDGEIVTIRRGVTDASDDYLVKWWIPVGGDVEAIAESADVECPDGFSAEAWAVAQGMMREIEAIEVAA